MKTKYMPLVVGILLIMVGTAAFAQPCVPSYPNVIPVGTSHCFHVCPGTYITIQLEGNLIGPGAVPVLILQPGCQQGDPLCNEPPCPAITPPADLIFGGDPYFPDDWYGETPCIIIYMRWVHDSVWEFEVFSFCEGCFCVTFDYQLAAQFNHDFMAESMDNAVKLTWSTASESDLIRYEILRSGEDIVGRVDATNGPTEHRYEFVDHSAANGTTYSYTLRSVGINNDVTTLATVQGVTPSFSAGLITEYALHQNYPNPFNPSTSIAFDLLQGGMAKLAIYNVIGLKVATLVDGNVSAGRHTAVFNGSNLTSGVYLYKLEANGFSDIKKLVLLK